MTLPRASDITSLILQNITANGAGDGGLQASRIFASRALKTKSRFDKLGATFGNC